MNILVVGGSNSRMLKGYTGYLKEELARLGVDVARYDNLSLGANTSLMGLQLLEGVNGASYDWILLEYSVNDYAMTGRGEWEIWRATLEGLLRIAIRKWPAARVCYVLLGRSNVKQHLWDRQVAETVAIVSHYPSVVASNVYEHFLSFPDSSSSLYADPMHYSDAGQRLAGEFTAKVLLSSGLSNNLMLPAPLSEDVVDPIRVLNFSELGLGRLKVFKNSVVDINSLELKRGDSIRLRIPGAPIGLVFVSAVDSGSLCLEVDGHRCSSDTLHEGVRERKFPFLPLSTWLGCWNRSGAVDIKISAMDSSVGDDSLPVFNVVPPVEDCFSVYLHKLIYRG